MNDKKKKNIRVASYTCIAILLALILVLASIGIYASRRKTTPNAEISNPIDWSIDEWDGNSTDSSRFFTGEAFGNRGEKVFTIDSAEAFAYFVSIVNDEATAKEYDYFAGYTIYLNRSIDMQGNTIESIGKKIDVQGVAYSTFQGTFDGSYYTIYNANIKGTGLFGYVENATIKNVGLYNCTINSEEEFVGGIVGYAINTNIENTYVRLGSITGSNVVGGIAGQFLSTNGMFSISNSFADTSLNGSIVGGIVGFGNANHSYDNSVDISYCYYTGEYDAYGYKDSIYVYSGNIIKATDIAQFSSWDYSSNYSLEKKWCKYSNVEGSEKLDFSYPILSAFNKVFLTGSYYESTMTDVSSGETKHYISLKDAFANAGQNTNIIRIIVDGIFVDETAAATGSSTIYLTSEVDTTIYRGNKNPEILISSSQNSTLILGNENSDENTPTITFDGRKDYVENNKLKSGALIYSQGNDFKIYSNVTLKNNINNISNSSYGGAIYLYNLKAGNTENNDGYVKLDGGIIENCTAGAGGGLAIVGCNAIVNNMVIRNCTGSGAYFSDEIEETNSYELDLATKNSDGTEIYTDGRVYDFKTYSTYQNNSGANKTFEDRYGVKQGSFGGGLLLFVNSYPTTLTINGGNISNNYATYGGGVASLSKIANPDENLQADYLVKLNLVADNQESEQVQNMSSTIKSTATSMGSSYIVNNSAQYGGGVYYGGTTLVGDTDTTIGSNDDDYGISLMATGAWYVNFYANGRLWKEIYAPQTQAPVWVEAPGSYNGYSFAGWGGSSTSTSASGGSGGNYYRGHHSGTLNYYAVYSKTGSSSSKTVYAYFRATSSSSNTYTSNARVTTTTITYANYTTKTTRNTTSSSGGNISYRSASLSGYTFMGWALTSTATTAVWTSGSRNLTASDYFYGVWRNTAGTSSTTDVTYSHRFYTASGSYSTRYTYQQTVRSGLYKYWNCSRSTSRVDTTNIPSSATTSTSFTSLSYSTASKSGYTFAGWTTSSTGTSASWTSGSKTLSANTDFYAVWMDSRGTRTSTTTYSHRFYTGSSAYTTSYSYRYQNYINVPRYYNYTLSNVRTSSSGGALYSTSYSTLLWKSASLAGYYFAGWTTTSGGTSPTWTSGNITSPGSSVYYYAVWRKDWTLNDTSTSARNFSTYYPYTTTANQRQYYTTSIPTLSGYTFQGYSTSYNGLSLGFTPSGSTIQIDSGTSQLKVFYAVWHGDYIVSTNNSSSVSTYGSTITASFYTGSGSAVSAKSAYRQQYYTYDTGYYDQNHAYSLSGNHSGSQTNKETERYYRLVNNGSTGSWTTSIPSLTLTVPYATSTLSGKTFSGWDTNASTSTADWTSGNKNVTSNTSYYAVWRDTTGTRSATATLTHTFYTDTNSSTTRTTTRTTPYTGVTKYYNYNLSSSRTLTTGGTAGTPSYTALSYQTASKSGYVFQGWTTSPTYTYTTWNGGNKTLVENTTFYAVWSDTSGTHDASSTFTHTYMNYSGNSTTTTTTFTNHYTGDTVNYNYNLTESTQTNNGTVSSTSYTPLTFPTPSLAGYYFGGWSRTNSTTINWKGGASYTPTSKMTFYAVWYKQWQLKDTATETRDYTTYYTYNITANQRQDYTVSNPTLSGFTFMGYRASEGLTPTYTAGSTNTTIDAGTSRLKIFYAIWNGDVITSTNNSSSVTSYGSTITASFNTGTGKAVSNKTAYRQQYYTYDTGYYNQNHSYDLSTHAGSQTSKETERYYRLVNNGSTGSWSTSIPNLTLTVPYATSSLSGKTFVGWDTNASTTTADWTSGSKNVSANTTYYAVWSDGTGTREVKETLTHNFRTGTSETADFTKQNIRTTPYSGVTRYLNYNLSQSRTLDTGGTAGSPTYSAISYSTASRNGYTFMGWTTSSTGTTASWTSGNQTPVSATTYYAVWKGNDSHSRVVAGSPTTGTGSYTVSFNGNTNTGGSTSNISGVINYTYARTQTYKLQYNYNLTSSREVDSSTGNNYISSTSYESITLPENGYTKTGHTFQHWALGSTSGAEYNPGDEYTATSSGGATFYAIWEIDKFTVTFNVNGNGTVNGQTSTTITEVPYGSTITVNGNAITINGNTVTATANPGYKFNGWANATGTITANRTITANFTAAQYVVTLDKQGGEGGDSSVTATYLQAMPNITPPVREGYIFNGYYASANGVGTKYYNVDGMSAHVYDITGTTTLYAYWTAISYNVAFDKNFTVSGAVSAANWGSMNGISTTYGTTITLYTNAFKRNGYTFVGWSTDRTATSATYVDGARVSNLTTTNNATVTLYAVWTLDRHTVTFNSNGGSSINSASGNYGSSIVLSSPNKTGYEFAGWVETADILGDGSTFVRVFYHDVQGGSVLFSTVDEAQSTNSQYKYSILSDLAKFIENGKYTFLLQYEYADGYNYWSQTSNPLDDYKGTSSPTTATGYNGINIDWDSNYWGGLTRQNSNINTKSSTLLSGSVGHGNWFYAIGAYSTHQTGMPTASDITVQGMTGSTSYGVSLWVKVDNLMSVANELSQLLGGSTYYIRNTDTTLTALWMANRYNITYLDEGGEPFSGTHEEGYPTSHVYGHDTELKGATKEGYNFDGWYTNSACTGEPITVIDGEMYTSNITLYAKWTAKSYTVYTGKSANTSSVIAPNIGVFNSALEFSWSALDMNAQYEYELVSVRIYSGNNANGTLLATITSGDSGEYTMTGTYYDSIYIYVEHRAIVRKYDITIAVNNGAYGEVDVDLIEDVEYGENITLTINGGNGTVEIAGTISTATANVGYHLGSWGGALNQAIVQGNMTITAIFEPNTNTKYTVNHYQENIANDNYTIYETENLTGTTGAEISPPVKTYEGFTSPSVQTTTILADGSSVINYYYTRNKYDLTLIAGEGIASVSGAGEYKYGAQASISATLMEGYNWYRWTGSATISTQNTTITITDDMTLTANGQLKTYIVSITAGQGGQVDRTSIEVQHGTAVSVEGNVLIIGSTRITATANTGYEFDSYTGIPESGTITGEITITANFAKTINITIEVTGNTNSGELYGVEVNGESTSESVIVRSGSTVVITGQTRANNEAANEYQIVTVYVNNVMRLGPLNGEIAGALTNLGAVDEDTKITFEFEEAYKIGVSITDNAGSEGVTIDAEKQTQDGIIAKDSPVTISIDSDTIIGGVSGKEYLGIVYKSDDMQISMPQAGNNQITYVPDESDEGMYVYKVNDVIIDELEIIVKSIVKITVDLPTEITGVDMISEDGFIRVVRNSGDYIVYSGKWTINTLTPMSEQELEELFGNVYDVKTDETGNYYIDVVI